MLDIDFAPFVCVLAAIVLDVISGVIKAGATNTMSSAVMRSGLWHKSSLIFLELVAFLAGFAPQYIEGLPQQLSAIYIAISCYICLMELVSILENIAKANPQISGGKLFSFFGISENPEENEQQEK